VLWPRCWASVHSESPSSPPRPGNTYGEIRNARLRKVTRNRGQFPSEQAALKVLYLAVRNLEEFRRPNVGIRSSGWKQALQAFTIYFDGRIPTP
jgi:transposase-like protein